MPRLKIEYRKTADLIPYVGNARTHTDAQVDQIARSIQEFGFVNPILIDGRGVIIAGHGRVMAALHLELKEVPVIQISNLSERQVKALVLADNKIASNAGWDMAKLADEIAALADMEMDLSVMGFDEQELDALLKSDNSILPDTWNIPEAGTFQTAPAPVPAAPVAPPAAPVMEAPPREETPRAGLVDDESVPEPEPVEHPVSRVGDIWIMGDHRLMCGNSLDPQHVAGLMIGAKADMVFTDPPYNVKISGIGSGNDTSVISKHGEFVMASGEMSEDQFTEFLRTVFRNMVNHSKDGAIHYVCMDWRHMREVLAAGDAYETRVAVGGGDEFSAEAAGSLEQGSRGNGDFLPE